MKLAKGEIICLKKSNRLLYRSYYIVQNVEKNKVYYTRCSVNSITTYQYCSLVSEIQQLAKFTIREKNYINKQISDNSTNIADEEPFYLYIKLTAETIKLLEKKYQILCIFDENSKTYTMYEILKNAKSVFLDIEYKTSLTEIKDGKFKWIEVLIGRKFQRSCIPKNH